MFTAITFVFSLKSKKNYSRQLFSATFLFSYILVHFKPKTDCPNNLVRSDEISECEPTCQTLYLLNVTHCSGPRWSGCTCPSGMVMNDGVCVDPEECPCLHHGKLYQPGEVISRTVQNIIIRF